MPVPARSYAMQEVKTLEGAGERAGLCRRAWPKKEAHGPAEPMRAARPGFNPRADLFAFCFYSPKPRPSVVRFPPTATISGPPPVGLPLRQKAKGGGGAGGAGVEWGVQAALAASRCALAAAAAALAFAAACCCLCRCLGLLSAKLLRLLQLRCSPTATSFFHSQKVVLKNTGLLSSAAHAQCSLSNQNDCSRCAGALFASAGSSE